MKMTFRCKGSTDGVNEDEIRRSQQDDIYEEFSLSIVLQERRNIPDLHNLKTCKHKKKNQMKYYGPSDIFEN